jgi:3-deoxy-manno-octulosonate cytidylyltransferase (CMP-KDO synthetase)
MTGRILGVIPARLASTRLPRKPLHPLLGRPLVEWVWRRAETMRVLDALVVATDDESVAHVCREIGAAVELTDPGHPSGTDRVAEVARRERWADFEVVVNLQGDEPLLDESHVAAAVELVTEGGWEVGTCATPIRQEALRHDPSVVKVARARDGRGLYFSRAPIPFQRDGIPDGEALSGPLFLRHLGLYVYARDALLRWVSLPPSPLEEVERLEQLRPLEAGMRIGVAVVEEAAPGVDTPEDARRMEERLRDSGGIGRPDQATTHA